MAISYAAYPTRLASGVSNDIVSTSRSYTSGDLVVVSIILEQDPGSPPTISNSATAQSWSNFVSSQAAGNCLVYAWYCVMSVTQSMTITTTASQQIAGTMYVIHHTGVDGTTPLPAGQVYSGDSGTDVSQAITPTQSGSCLWMIAGDWGATDSFAAITNCTLEDDYHDSGRYTAALVRPTTQPRTDANAFTIGETDTSGTIAWVAFEVVAGESFVYDESLAPNGVTLVNLTGSYTDIDEDPDSPDANWLTAI